MFCQIVIRPEALDSAQGKSFGAVVSRDLVCCLTDKRQ